MFVVLKKAEPSEQRLHDYEQAGRGRPSSAADTNGNTFQRVPLGLRVRDTLLTRRIRTRRIHIRTIARLAGCAALHWADAGPHRREERLQ